MVFVKQSEDVKNTGIKFVNEKYRQKLKRDCNKDKIEYLDTTFG